MTLNSCTKLRWGLKCTPKNRHTPTHPHTNTCTWMNRTGCMREYREHFSFCVPSDLFLSQEHHLCIPGDVLKPPHQGVRKFIFMLYCNDTRSQKTEARSKVNGNGQKTIITTIITSTLQVMVLLTLNGLERPLLVRKTRATNDEVCRNTIYCTNG